MLRFVHQTSLLDSRVPGYVGLLEQADCRQLLTSTLGGSYVIRELSPAVGGGYEVVVKHVSDDVVGLRIVARPDGRLEYKQRLYYRLKDVMFEICQCPRPAPLRPPHGHAVHVPSQVSTFPTLVRRLNSNLVLCFGIHFLFAANAFQLLLHLQHGVRSRSARRGGVRPS